VANILANHLSDRKKITNRQRVGGALSVSNFFPAAQIVGGGGATGAER